MATERDDLDDLFTEARADAPRDDLVARVLAEAAEVQAAARPMPRPKVRRSWVSRAVSAVGGWAAASWITAAGVMGLAVGFYAPDTLTAWLGTDVYFGGGYAATPDLSALWLEGGDV